MSMRSLRLEGLDVHTTAPCATGNAHESTYANARATMVSFMMDMQEVFSYSFASPGFVDNAFYTPSYHGYI